MIPPCNISLISNTLVTAGERQLPPFDDAFREVLRTVRAANLPTDAS